VIPLSSEDVEAITREIELVGRRAIKFQNYVLRRAWGIYYAVWSLAIFLYGFVPFVAHALAPTYGYSALFYIVIYAVIGGLAGWVTMVNFSKAWRTIRLRRALDYPKRSSAAPRISLFFAIFFGYFASFYLAQYFFGLGGEALTYALLFSVSIYVYVWLKRSFEKAPVEGLLACVSYGSASIVSVYAVIARLDLLITISWSLTILVWVFASIYALYRAPEEMVNDD
jgi:hypothetical protein